MSTRLTPNDHALRAITEAALQQHITALAEALEWRSYHAPDNRPVTARSGRRYVQNIRAGFPDLILTRGPRLIAAELKRQTGRATTDQHAWLEALAVVPGVEAYLWRPSDLPHIREVLA